MKNMNMAARTVKTLSVLVIASVLFSGCSSPSSSPATQPSGGDQEMPAQTEAADTAGESSGPSAAEAAPSSPVFDAPHHYEVEKLGSIADPNEELSFINYPVKRVGDNEYFVDLNGNTMLDTPILDVKSLLDDLYVLSVDTEGPNNKALVSLSRGVIIPPEAAIIELADGLQGRYLEVVYGTEATTDKSEAFFYSHQGMFSFGPQDGDTLYKGYAKLFDIKANGFVNGIELASPGIYITDLGDYFVIDDRQSKTLYSSGGAKLWTGDLASFGANAYVVGSYPAAIYSYNGEELYVSENSISVVSGDRNLFVERGANAQDDRLIDERGNTVLEIPGAYYEEERDGIVMVSINDEKRAVDASGQTIASGDFHIQHILDGYTLLRFDGDEARYELLFDGKEVLTYSGEIGASDLVFEDVDNEDMYYVFGAKDYVLSLATVTKTVEPGLVVGRALRTTTYSLFDLFTGAELIAGYDRICSSGGFVFAQSDDTWDVYAIRFV